jgi:hypothetical protein
VGRVSDPPPEVQDPDRDPAINPMREVIWDQVNPGGDKNPGERNYLSAEVNPIPNPQTKGKTHRTLRGLVRVSRIQNPDHGKIFLWESWEIRKRTERGGRTWEILLFRLESLGSAIRSMRSSARIPNIPIIGDPS